MQADLILLVIDSDITIIELQALQILITKGKPILLVLNRCDQWSLDERNALLRSIRNRLPLDARSIDIEAVSAAPRKVFLTMDGRVRSERVAPQIENLQWALINLLESQGELLLTLNALRQSESFCQCLQRNRLQRNKAIAQGLIGRFAAIKASGVAANPFLLIDVAGGLACDTTLVLQLCKLYGIKVKGHTARSLITQLSGQNVLLGGAQLSIQIALGVLRQVLIFAAPLTGGLSLAPAAPIAIVQAALAVHTTKMTGRLAAQEVIRTSSRTGTQPDALLRRLEASDPQIKSWLYKWPNVTTRKTIHLQALLP